MENSKTSTFPHRKYRPIFICNVCDNCCNLTRIILEKNCCITFFKKIYDGQIPNTADIRCPICGFNYRLYQICIKSIIEMIYEKK